ncbi:protoglobin domain-containing protein [Methylocella silvestris]|uniref:protoglobin domain-containing protein n=1 Tax=Methylocella silvestris TaxID=199596 RepID=UPI0011AFA8E0|nr:protoglobin domain-containing protein [Methylocella silvestris]
MSDLAALADRLNFVALDNSALAQLRALRPLLMAEMPRLLDAFYAKIGAFPQTRAMFSGPAEAERAKAAQLQHWDRIARGGIDGAYIAAVKRIGAAHARIGLAPRWYIGGYSFIIEGLIGAILRERWPKSHRPFGLGGARPDPHQTAAEIAAVVKAALLDMDYSISVYIESSEAARMAVEARMRQTNAAVIAVVGDALGALAKGRLTHRIGDVMPPEYAGLRDDFNAAISQLHETVVAITGAAPESARARTRSARPRTISPAAPNNRPRGWSRPLPPSLKSPSRCIARPRPQNGPETSSLKRKRTPTAAPRLWATPCRQWAGLKNRRRKSARSSASSMRSPFRPICSL